MSKKANTQVKSDPSFVLRYFFSFCFEEVTKRETRAELTFYAIKKLWILERECTVSESPFACEYISSSNNKIAFDIEVFIPCD